MATHYLKTWPEHFRAILLGEKKAELRLNDRNFQVGDTLVLQEYSPGGVEHVYDDRQADGVREDYIAPFYTDSELEVEVTHILHGGEFGLQKWFVMMSIERTV